MIIHIVQGDLLDQDVDVIVNAWNRNVIPWWLLLPQGVSGAIKRRGGTGPFKELRKHGAIPLGGAALTSAGRLPFKGIIHVAGINLLWRASERSIRASVRNAATLASESGFQSIAFPLIGAGSGGFHPGRVREIMEDELRRSGCPLEATIVIFGKADSSVQRKGPQTMRLATRIASDPSVPFAERVEATKQVLRMELDRAGLARGIHVLIPRALVSIRLETAPVSEDDLPVGSSKLGGTPDLPDGMPWPECNGVPMGLLAQLRLQDVAPYDVEGRLPDSGMLYFFYEAAEQAWGYDPKHRGNWQVMYFDGDPARLRASVPPPNLPAESRFSASKPAFFNDLTFPSWRSAEVEDLDLSHEQWKLVYGDLDAYEPIHRIFGHANVIQNEMQLECQLASHGLYCGDESGYNNPRGLALAENAADWRLLLQIDSDDNMATMWGDSGRVYFWIREQDLQVRDFGNVWLVLQCY